VSALVTGAGTGIGAAIARTLAARGYAVAVTDLELAPAREVAADLDQAVALRLDVTDRGSIEAACREAVERLGPLEAWVSNAGVSSMTPFVDVPEAEIDATLAVNTKGVMLCGQVAARQMLAQEAGGAIVNVASMAGKRGAVPYLAHYVASKFAVVGLTQAMAHELGSYGIRVNSVCPGYVATSMQERELQWEASLSRTSLKAVRDLYIADTPLGRLETPEDVAHAVAFLAGGEAEFITGEALSVNGGAHMD
jgi:meso-butanediol dehydrogenase / (S,S)-butanediol dehydrogenase / diacetyl reductase